jgi:hypothetical protein
VICRAMVILALLQFMHQQFNRGFQFGLPIGSSSPGNFSPGPGNRLVTDPDRSGSSPRSGRPPSRPRWPPPWP